MLDLFKPYQFANSLKTPLIFNEVEQPYNPIFKSFRPFIIFYDDAEHQYWYLKARTKTEKSKKQEFEVLVPKNDATMLLNLLYYEMTLTLTAHRSLRSMQNY